MGSGIFLSEICAAKIILLPLFCSSVPTAFAQVAQCLGETPQITLPPVLEKIASDPQMTNLFGKDGSIPPGLRNRVLTFERFLAIIRLRAPPEGKVELLILLKPGLPAMPVFLQQSLLQNALDSQLKIQPEGFLTHLRSLIAYKIVRSLQDRLPAGANIVFSPSDEGD